MSEQPEEEPGFEQAYTELERAVHTLEGGGLTLEDSISLYERCMKLARLCSARLDAAELRITELQSALDQPPSPEAGASPADVPN
ncbi:MAG: exodeoxyribonuclease VII small subunit [Chloroflexi bacterium]|nr:exodeoxyribonuclease VII small subunit [Chloroflexota bacterium]